MNTSKSIIAYLKSLENKANQEGMKRFAIGNENTLGINIPVLRNLAKSYKKNPARHQLAMELWQSNIHEAMILASMIADPKKLTPHEMDSWTHDFYSWDICDQTCSNLFQKTTFFLDKAFEYSYAKEEFVKRTGFVLMVQYVTHHKQSLHELCPKFLQRIEEESNDNRNFVRKAVNWCLRTIGKRNLYLHSIAIETAQRILLQNTPAAKWIANNTLTELKQEKIVNRIKP